MKAVIIFALLLLIVLALPVLADGFNTYLSIGGVHWIWCGNVMEGTDGRVQIYPIRDWAIKVECAAKLPDPPQPKAIIYLPVIMETDNVP